MILKKPYALFIKLFKPLHLLLSAAFIWLIALENNILRFLNNYIYSTETKVSTDVISELSNNLLYILPIILILFSILILSIMFKKKKPIKLYIISIFLLIFVIIINFYTFNFLKILTENAVAIRSIKLIHDFLFINIAIEGILFVLYIVRGTGVNLKKFDFNSDLLKMEISESDKEEIELNINIDVNESIRKRRNKIRNFKYFYQENKLIFIISFMISFVILTVISFLLIFGNKKNIEGNTYYIDSVNIKVNSTYILNKDFEDNLLTNNYLVIVKTDLSSYLSKKKIELNDIKLNIEGVKFSQNLKYSKKILDIGNTYNEELLTNDFKEYLFVFEVPEKYIKSKMSLDYVTVNSNLSIILNPKELKILEGSEENKLGENISFINTLGDINFNIKNVDIQKQYLIEYNYCVKNDDCILSREYIKPKINQNYDKVVLKLNVDYSNNSSIPISSFYNFFNKFGDIYYEIDNTLYSQKNGFEEIKSLKSNNKDIVYIGVNSNIMNSSKVYLIFNIRGYKYKYLLKGEV